MSFYDVEKSAAISTSSTNSNNSPVVIKELDQNGFLSTIYEGTSPANITLRNAKEKPQFKFASSMELLQSLINVFLPTGYPHSVSPDYIDYQIYDSIQAFSSSIASLFANRAVLKAVGVGDDTSTSTSALFMKITQETVGRLGTILFAWKLGSSLEPECKKYRYVADLVNDSAIVFDCLSPLFPGNKSVKVFFLCMSGLLRSICGVMAGGSRAALTQHFTDPKLGSIADVNAKDQSQETVISLMGMLAGSIVVKIVQGDGIEMWLTVILLLSIHLITNYKAVSSVIIRTLNRQRTNIVFSDIVNSLNEFDETMLTNDPLNHLLVSPKLASYRERILETDGILRWYSTSRTSKNKNDEIIGKALFTDFKSLISIIPNTISIEELSTACHSIESGYILYYTFQTSPTSTASSLPTINICLLNNRKKDSDIKAWVHALILSRNLIKSKNPITNPLQPIDDSYEIVIHIFEKLDIEASLSKAGWDLDRYSIQTKPVPTIIMNDTPDKF